ncbi:MAG: LamG-like jellyroll fold domain-containing protein, partial [bacterium]
MNFLLGTMLLGVTAQAVTNTPASLLPHGKRTYTQNQNLNQQEWDASFLSVGGPPINTSQSYLAKTDEKMANPPLTIKARVKTANRSAFNIFVAYEPKSGAHWELYSYTKSGTLSFFIPGNRPAEIRSTALVVDNQWHDIQVNWTPDKIVLLMDGKPVAEAPYNRPAATVSNPKIGVGRLVEGTLRLDGQVINVEVNGCLLEKVKMSETESPSALFPSEGQNLYTPGVKPPKNIPVASYTLISLPSFQLESVKPEMFRPGVIAFWSEYVKELENQISGAMPLPRGAADQVYDKQSLIQSGEKTAFDVMLRRTQLVIDLSKAHPDAEKWQRDLNRIKAVGKPEDVFALCALRRVVMLADPALSAYNSMVFVGRATYAGSRLTSKSNTDRTGGHFATQCFGFNTIAGGGLFVLDCFTAAQPRVRNLLDGAIVQNGTYQGKPITEGSFWSPEVSYDGKTVYFAHCASKQHVWQWTEDTTWKIFKIDIATKKIWQLTEGPWNDFDPTELPSGRVVFVSERRGAFIRCFTEPSRHRVPTFVLHSMKNDGRDIYPLSYYETS